MAPPKSRASASKLNITRIWPKNTIGLSILKPFRLSARKRLKVILANSEGWNKKFSNASQLFEPYSSTPKSKGEASKATVARKKIREPIFLSIQLFEAKELIKYNTNPIPNQASCLTADSGLIL